jgi:tRNA (guanosine-2'-O-)-methyltransferase
MDKRMTGTRTRPLTARRESRIRQVLARRQKDLTLVLNNVHDPHNVSAILRSCDAFGVFGVHLLYTSEGFPDLSRRSSASARKWIDRQRHTSALGLIKSVQGAGLQLLATSCEQRASRPPEIDLTQPWAIVLGNEHRGIDPELRPWIDKEIHIPMQGMVQSLNVSVAAAIILYEAWRQRSQKGMYDRPSLGPDERQGLFELWSQR